MEGFDFSFIKRFCMHGTTPILQEIALSANFRKIAIINMFWFYFFLALSSCAVIRCEDEGNDQGTVIGEEMIKAIQDKMDKLDFLVKILKTLFNFSLEPEQEAARSDNCLPPGSECNAFSGPNCCGVRTRCYIFDTQVATRRGPAKWISRCKDYPLGVLLDNISG